MTEARTHFELLIDWLDEYQSKDLNFLMAGDANQYINDLRKHALTQGFATSKFRQTRRSLVGEARGRETDIIITSFAADIKLYDDSAVCSDHSVLEASIRIKNPLHLAHRI